MNPPELRMFRTKYTSIFMKGIFFYINFIKIICIFKDNEVKTNTTTGSQTDKAFC